MKPCFCVAERLKLEGANVVNMDIPADNGLIHVVETVVEMPARPPTQALIKSTSFISSDTPQFVKRL